MFLRFLVEEVCKRDRSRRHIGRDLFARAPGRHRSARDSRRRTGGPAKPRSMLATFVVIAVFAAFAPLAAGGEADVIGAKVRRAGPGTFDFDVTVRSVDRGATHWADAIEVLTRDGKLLGRRELVHSHEDEQPFTRDVYGVRIPAGVAVVVIRVHHKVKGYDGETLTLVLPSP